MDIDIDIYIYIYMIYVFHRLLRSSVMYIYLSINSFIYTLYIIY